MRRNPAAGGTPDIRRRGVRPRCSADDAATLVRRAYEAGVRITAGTDAMADPADPYAALLDEIRLLHESAGLPMASVIQAATWHGAMAAGVEDRTGAIETGRDADIVFLREDPGLDPRAFRSVHLTLKRGRAYPRSDFSIRDSRP